MDPARLHQMVDQIARNLEIRGHDLAVAATADHIATFWDPRMKATIYASDRTNLSSIAREAVNLLATCKAPPRSSC